jgi:hypothetical protein
MSTHRRYALYLIDPCIEVWYLEKSVPGIEFVLTSCANATEHATSTSTNAVPNFAVSGKRIAFVNFTAVFLFVLFVPRPLLQHELLRVLGLRCRSLAFYCHLQRPPQHVVVCNCVLFNQH